MVVLVDLDDETHAPGKPLHHSFAPAVDGDNNVEAVGRPNLNINGFSAILRCYPVVSQLASQLDLNTLHNLSRTCRQFRANLLEYRDQLIRHTLRCDFEDAAMGTRLAERLVEARANFQSSRQLTSGRVGKCARDMVGECQRCGTVVCRNCTIKPPPTPALRARHRRLCRTCSKAPLRLLTTCKTARSGSRTPSPPTSPSPRPTLFDKNAEPAFTAAAFERTPCSCDTMVWLCQPCGQHLRNTDTLYLRAWVWRTRYTHYLGGVGTGCGEGNEGVACGRGSGCLAAKIVEHEVDCDAETLASLEGTSQSPDRWTGTSYHAQEIEGIGGVFKMKAKRQVRVGECVKIYEDERDRSIQFLGREVAGKLRSWCSWCDRTVLGEKDKAEALGERPPSSSSSSASSSK